MKNVYCKDITVDFELDTTPIDRIKLTESNFTENGQFTVTELDTNLINFLDNLDIVVVHPEVFYTPPGSGINIHVDGIDVDVNAVCKLNWVYSAPGSYMTWWQLKDENTPLNQHKTSIGTSYLLFAYDDCKQVWKQEIGQPSLVNAGLPHNMHNPSNEGRWCISYVLGDKITNKLLRWEDAVVRFSKYFKE